MRRFSFAAEDGRDRMVRYHNEGAQLMPLARGLRALARLKTLDLLGAIQPESGGYLEAAPLTSFVSLSLLSMGLAYLVAIPVGIHAAVRKGSASERITSVALFTLYSLPSFVAALLLLIVFYQNLEGTVFQLKPGMKSDDYDQLSKLGKVLDIANYPFSSTRLKD